ncbi:hypothetical protein EDD63_12820 [Breznakia blatticola]|uniref:Uncharacterized protein n=1 Tax=Breznakia blatticola TaxID=1754012 RepID=A0A4R7ZGF0_9FIRM|nr:hypothetical protein [Breznakia blatticola]TDW16116.1 hypothetical protein EDD63_12820 [Breznakia blatticola]
MNVFNTDNLRNKQRFPVAMIYGIICSIICAILIAAFYQVFHGWYYSLIYVGAALAIGNVIKYMGRGIDIKFSILAVLCFILCLGLAEFFRYAFMLQTISFQLFTYSLTEFFGNLFTADPYNIVRIIIIAYSGYVAYYTAKIV